MADAVDTQVLFSGGNQYAVRLTGLSDGTGETAVLKVDKSSLIGPLGAAPSKLRIDEISWDISGWDGVVLDWDGTTDTHAMVLSTNGYMDFRPVGGLVSDNADGTGDLLLTTKGTATANFTYVITIFFRLKG